MTLLRSLIAATAGVVLALGAVSSASAAPSAPVDIDPQIAQMMDEVPGGVVIDAQHAVWPDLGMELIVPSSMPNARATVGTCQNGLVCLYTGYSLSGTILTFNSCGIHSVPSSFSARSLAHARSTGYTQARASATVLATASVGGWANIYGATTNVRCIL